MDLIEKIFSLFNKAERAMSQADSMRRTVARVGDQTQYAKKGGGVLKTIVVILIFLIVILYFIFSK